MERSTMIEMRWAILSLSMCCAFASAQTLPTTTAIEIDARALSDMYRREMGETYQPAMFEKLRAAHREIEAYFAGDSKRRAEVVKTLQASGIDPNFLGRITRIRLHWPSVATGVYYINEQVGASV